MHDSRSPHDSRSHHPGRSFLLALAKPVLDLAYASYARELRSAPFPLDEPELEIPGADPDRLLFIGSIAVAGFGVLHNGMKASSRTAAIVAVDRGHGVTWTEFAHETMTAAAAADLPGLEDVDADVAVVILGICDTLLATDPELWTRDLGQVVARLRAGGRKMPIVFAGIPPMDEFRANPPIVGRLLRSQVARLNAATERFVAATPGTTYVPFPTLEVGSLFIQDALSWATMHKLWGRAIAPAVVSRLAVRTVTTAS